jgi:hypothetical protein
MALERRTFSTGRERIDPGPGHDDLCNSAAIALSLLDLKKSMVVSDKCVAAVSRQMPDRYGRPNRFSQRGRPPTTSSRDWLELNYSFGHRVRPNQSAK